MEEMGLTSKDMAAKWGGAYRDKISVIRAIKSVTTKTFPHPVRVDQDASTGALITHAGHPAELPLPEIG